MAPVSKLLPWSEVRVWIEDPVLHSAHILTDRRAVVALARWKEGDPPANHRYVDAADARPLSGAGEVDWSRFPPSADPNR